MQVMQCGCNFQKGQVTFYSNGRVRLLELLIHSLDRQHRNIILE